ncbi:MAG: glyoxalase [Deltaproteobacteria bacterium HGW-Deltaproteobacteria-17]|nr:MAG: glyoxalase [Deltaproteobacteria bacterium HGW-Deltaproteobacteria-17]
MQLSFVTIHVEDLDKTIEFYRAVLGFEVERRFKAGPRVELAFVNDGHGGVLEFITGTGRVVETRGLSLGFIVEDLEKTAEHLRARDVVILHGPETTPGGVKLLNARDLNGVELGFVEYSKDIPVK